MAKESYVPPIEGVSDEPTRLREFKNGEFPVEIALRKSDFDYLGNWKIFMSEEGYGLAYRLEIKNNVIDDEDDPATLTFNFYNLLARRGLSMTPEKEKEQFKKLEQVVQVYTILCHHGFAENMISYTVPAPDWMFKELQDSLGNHKKSENPKREREF